MTECLLHVDRQVRLTHGYSWRRPSAGRPSSRQHQQRRDQASPHSKPSQVSLTVLQRPCAPGQPSGPAGSVTSRMDTPAVPTSHVKRRKTTLAVDPSRTAGDLSRVRYRSRVGGRACGRQLPAGAGRADRRRRLAAERRRGGRAERVRIGGERRSVGSRRDRAPRGHRRGLVAWARRRGRCGSTRRRGDRAWPPRAAPHMPTPPTRRVGTAVTLPGFAPGGHIDAAAIERAAPDVAKAADLLAQADAELAPIDADSLQPPLDRLMREAKDEIHTPLGAGNDGGQPCEAAAADARRGRRADLPARDPLPLRPTWVGRLSRRVRAAARRRTQALPVGPGADIRDPEGAAGRRARRMRRRPGDGPASIGSSGTRPTRPTSPRRPDS